MTEQLLNRSDVRATLEKMGGKRMAKHVTGHTLSYFRLSRSITNRALHLRLVKMVPPRHAQKVDECPGRREQIEPGPFTIGVGKLSRQRTVGNRRDGV